MVRHRRARALLVVSLVAGVAALAAVSAQPSSPSPRVAGAGASLSPRTPVPAAGSSSAAGLVVRLERDDALAIDLAPRPGTTTAVVLVTLKGTVPQVVDAGGQPAGRSQDNLLGVEVDWGDGAVDRSASQNGCVFGAALIDVLSSVPVIHFYARAGTFTVTVRARACAPVGEVTQTIALSVAPPVRVGPSQPEPPPSQPRVSPSQPRASPS